MRFGNLTPAYIGNTEICVHCLTVCLFWYTNHVSIELDGWTDRWIDGKMENGKMDRWKDGKMDRWKDGKMDRWIDGKMERWIDGWMDG